MRTQKSVKFTPAVPVSLSEWKYNMINQ
jgi:hypothetical protein